MVKGVLIAVGMFVVAMITATTPAHAEQYMCEVPHKWVGNYGEGHALFHDWYKTLSSKSGRNCCNGSECRPTQAEYRQDGWYAKVDGAWTKMPEEAVIGVESPDLGAHVCAVGDTVYCFDPGLSGT